MAGRMAPPPKQEELQPHPVASLTALLVLPLGVNRTLGPRNSEAALLGFQHYLVILGMTVFIPTFLVPQMGGGNVSFWP